MSDRPFRVRQYRGKSLPAGVRSCARPHLFGNPFKLGAALARTPAADMVTPWEYENRVPSPGRHDMRWPGGAVTRHEVRLMTVEEIIRTHRRALIAPTSELRLYHTRSRTFVTVDLVRRELAGRNLACYCDPFSPCHVDTLLWVANARLAEVESATEAEYQAIRAVAARVEQMHPQVAVLSALDAVA